MINSKKVITAVLVISFLAGASYAGAAEKKPSASEIKEQVLLITKANNCLDEAKYNEAIADYTKVLKKNPKYVAAYHSRGFAHAQKGEFDKAIADYTRALEINANLSDVYVHRAMAYFAKKEFEKSRQDIDKAEKLGLEDYFSYNEKMKKVRAKVPCAKMNFSREEYKDFIERLRKESGQK